MVNLEDHVGRKVDITTLDGESLQGLVYSVQGPNGVVTVVKSNVGGKLDNADVEVIKHQFIKDVEFIGDQRFVIPAVTVSESSKNTYKKPVVAPAAGTSLSGDHKGELEFNRRRIVGGRKLSAEGQAVFDQLYTLLPEGDVTFDSNDNILIFGNHLAVLKPYTAESIKVVGGGNEDDQQLTYIRTVIKDIWDKLESERKGG